MMKRSVSKLLQTSSISKQIFGLNSLKLQVKSPIFPTSYFKNFSTSKINQTTQNKEKYFSSFGPKWILFTIGAVGTTLYLVVDNNQDTINAFADDERKRQRVIILGSGWGAVSLLKTLDTSLYEVVIVSPRNYFLFTPLLPSSAVGTIDCRSIVEPIRDFIKRIRAQAEFYESECIDVDFQSKKITCRDASDVKSDTPDFQLSYDHLIVAVGAINNTYNTPGVQKNAHFLKQVEDSLEVRRKVIDLFETASLPETSDEEKKRLLHFVVCGGGPTGIEYAGELSDLIKEDLQKLYPDAIKNVKITVIQSGDHVLNTYDQAISEYTEKEFLRQNINVFLNTRVLEVKEKNLVIADKKSGIQINVPYGICIWSTGNAPTEFAKKIQSKLPTAQTNKVGILTNELLEVKGAPNVYAIGDCATVEQKQVVEDFLKLFKEADTNGDGKLSYDELRKIIIDAAPRYSQLAFYGKKIHELFANADENKDGSLSQDEFKKLLVDIDSKTKPLPATAQCAKQQGKYLANVLNKKAKNSEYIPDAFTYNHAGSFAYVGGNSAVMEVGNWKLSGFATWLMWRGAYWGMQFSFKSRIRLASEWIWVYFFGRDTSRF